MNVCKSETFFFFFFFPQSDDFVFYLQLAVTPLLCCNIGNAYTRRLKVNCNILLVIICLLSIFSRWISNLLLNSSLIYVLQGLVSQRTRSKLPLKETPLECLEMAFKPPDVTDDMYESEVLDDDWKTFLIDFIHPLRMY